jgi:uncharacterized protein (DUF58 family)
VNTPPWDAAVLARIASLELRARRAVEGVLHGHHGSVRTTSALEFADYKEYAPGDPIKDLDWRVMGRSDRLVIRRHRAEAELATTLVLDASGDGATGRGGAHPRGRPPLDGTRWGSAVVFCAALAWWLERHQEPVGLLVLGGDDVRWSWLPPATGRAQLVRVLGVLAGARPAGRTDLGAGLRSLGARLPRRSVAVLVSDLAQEPAEWGPAAATLRARRADLRVVHLIDRPLRFFSPEGGAPLPEDPAELRAAFVAERDAFFAEARGHLSAAEAGYVPFFTDTPVEQPLARVLAGG